MKHAGGGFEQSYDAHTAVDAETQIIVAADSDRLPELVAAVRRNLDEDRPKPWPMPAFAARPYWRS